MRGSLKKILHKKQLELNWFEKPSLDLRQLVVHRQALLDQQLQQVVKRPLQQLLQNSWSNCLCRRKREEGVASFPSQVEVENDRYCSCLTCSMAGSQQTFMFTLCFAPSVVGLAVFGVLVVFIVLVMRMKVLLRAVKWGLLDRFTMCVPRVTQLETEDKVSRPIANLEVKFGLAKPTCPPLDNPLRATLDECFFSVVAVYGGLVG